MKFLAVLPFLIVGSLAAAHPKHSKDMPDGDNQKSANCKKIVPFCTGGAIIGQATCNCPGQVGPCDGWTCPKDRSMVCGQQQTGCVYI